MSLTSPVLYGLFLGLKLIFCVNHGNNLIRLAQQGIAGHYYFSMTHYANSVVLLPLIYKNKKLKKIRQTPHRVQFYWLIMLWMTKNGRYGAKMVLQFLLEFISNGRNRSHLGSARATLKTGLQRSLNFHPTSLSMVVSTSFPGKSRYWVIRKTRSPTDSYK